MSMGSGCDHPPTLGSQHADDSAARSTRRGRRPGHPRAGRLPAEAVRLRRPHGRRRPGRPRRGQAAPPGRRRPRRDDAEARRVRGHASPARGRATADMRVLLLTRASEADVSRGFDAGADDYSASPSAPPSCRRGYGRASSAEGRHDGRLPARRDRGLGRGQRGFGDGLLLALAGAVASFCGRVAAHPRGRRARAARAPGGQCGPWSWACSAATRVGEELSAMEGPPAGWRVDRVRPDPQGRGHRARACAKCWPGGARRVRAPGIDTGRALDRAKAIQLLGSSATAGLARAGAGPPRPGPGGSRRRGTGAGQAWRPGERRALPAWRSSSAARYARERGQHGAARPRRGGRRPPARRAAEPVLPRPGRRRRAAGPCRGARRRG